MQKFFRRTAKAYFGKHFSLFYYIKQVDNISPLSVHDQLYRMYKKKVYSWKILAKLTRRNLAKTFC